MNKKLPEILKKYRESLGLSQKELAIELQTTQATISRIESGKQESISKIILEKIEQCIFSSSRGRELMGKIITERDVSNKKALSKAQIKSSRLGKQGISYSHVIFGEDCGDAWRLHSCKKSKKSFFMLADTVGHGKNSLYMSFALEYGFETIFHILQESMLELKTIDFVLSSAIVKTSTKWKGEPGLLIGSIDEETGHLEFISSGLPYPLHGKNKKIDFIKREVYKAISFQDGAVKREASALELSEGESIIFYSDGLLDIFDYKELRKKFEDASTLFKGDSSAIAKNLQGSIERSNAKEQDYDDISYVIISKKIT